MGAGAVSVDQVFGDEFGLFGGVFGSARHCLYFRQLTHLCHHAFALSAWPRHALEPCAHGARQRHISQWVPHCGVAENADGESAFQTTLRDAMRRDNRQGGEENGVAISS